MDLPDIIRSAAGITVSFGIGLYIGHEAARADSIFEREGPSFLENIALLGAGVLPQAAISSSDPLQSFTMYSGGIAGAFIGRHIGRKIWHRRYDGRALTEEHKNTLEELKQKLKNTITNDEEFKKADNEFMNFVYKLLLYNAKPKLIKEITEQTAKEITDYKGCYEMLEQIQCSEGMPLISRTKKDSTLNGLVYINDNNKWIRIETTIDMHTVRRDNEPFSTGDCSPSITKEETTEYNIKDIAEELRTTDRLIVLAGGNQPLDQKKAMAIITYTQEAIMYTLRKNQSQPTT